MDNSITEQIDALVGILEDLKCEAFEPHRRDFMARAERKLRDKLNSKADDLLPTRKARKRRFRRHAMKNVIRNPCKILGSRFRSR